MDDTLLREQLYANEQRMEALIREFAAMRADYEKLSTELPVIRGDYEALADATQVITEDRESLRRRVAEL